MCKNEKVKENTSNFFLLSDRIRLSAWPTKLEMKTSNFQKNSKKK